MTGSPEFWEYLDELVSTSELVIDRPRGSHHPSYPDLVYPLDYGYLAGTGAGDGDGIDVWVGSQGAPQVVGLVCTVDLLKREAEIKILLNCNLEEVRQILAGHNTGQQAATLVMRP